MNAEAAIELETQPRKKRNWWKIGFFVALFAFEGAREIAVVGSDWHVIPNALASVDFARDVDGLSLYAVGTWRRTDGGQTLMPTTVRIECHEAQKECLVASARMWDEYVFVPDIDRYTATFATDSITYEEDFPVCVTIKTRIDLKLRKVYSLADRKPGVTDKNCRGTEARKEMVLGDTPPPENKLKKHFVPLLSLLDAVLSKKAPHEGA